jgi:hypothetical protein
MATSPSPTKGRRVMKAYMAFSRCAGPSEGASIVFADNARQAKILAWKTSTLSDYWDGEFTDVGIRLLKDKPWLFKEQKLDVPHVVDDPRSCTQCNMWGNSEIGADGLCDGCREANDV